MHALITGRLEIHRHAVRPVVLTCLPRVYIAMSFNERFLDDDFTRGIAIATWLLSVYLI